jgi:hypothetical protein
MSDAWESGITRITTGFLNTVNDSSIGGTPSIGSRSRYAGQLGKVLWVAQENITSMYSAAVGTLFGGRFRYVRFRAGDTAPVVGQAAFWDTTVAAWQTAYQVTRTENRSSVDNAVLPAGIFISIPTAGNYCFIQDVGQVNVKFRGTLTAAGAIGSRVFLAGAGAGADEGFADVLTAATAATFGDIGLQTARYLGVAVVAPTSGGVKAVMLRFNNILG